MSAFNNSAVMQSIPGAFPFCSCVTASPSLGVASQAETNAIISFNYMLLSAVIIFGGSLFVKN